ncbi:hypothetical protein GCM10017786_59920 [Amycolatopsis deserti]|uniref:Uncharacterized protein n=1 Tax=Amycolatopsis deserti TaxID=185696 RepID=A0ABQ3JBA1_9PSEU|nr:hypothetical protein GCM10017786_59920 [Amycolatopsis deserti]
MPQPCERGLTDMTHRGAWVVTSREIASGQAWRYSVHGIGEPIKTDVGGGAARIRSCEWPQREARAGPCAPAAAGMPLAVAARQVHRAPDPPFRRTQSPRPDQLHRRRQGASTWAGACTIGSLTPPPPAGRPRARQAPLHPPATATCTASTAD